MKSKLILILAVFTCFSMTSCVKSQDKNEGVKEAFSKKYPEAEKVKWDIDKNDYHEAHFELGDKKYRADFKSDGSWVETERSVDWDNLPEAVRKTIEASYDKDDIVEIEEVDHHSDGLYYDVEFKDDGDKLDIQINSSGNIIGKDRNEKN